MFTLHLQLNQEQEDKSTALWSILKPEGVSRSLELADRVESHDRNNFAILGPNQHLDTLSQVMNTRTSHESLSYLSKNSIKEISKHDKIIIYPSLVNANVCRITDGRKTALN